MSAARRAAALLAALGVALFLVGCAAQGSSSDDQRHGFYGGIEGGGSRL